MAAVEDDDSPQLSVAAELDGSGAAVVALAGELDMSNVELLEQAVERLAAAQPPRLIVDLSGLRFMDTAGIAALVGAAGRFNDAVELRDPAPMVRRVLEFSGLTGILRTQP